MNWRRCFSLVVLVLAGWGMFAQSEPESSVRDAWLQSRNGQFNERIPKGSVVSYGQKSIRTDRKFHVFHGLKDSLAIFDVDTVPISDLSFIELRDFRKYKRSKDGANISLFFLVIGMYGSIVLIYSILIGAFMTWISFGAILLLIGVLAIPLFIFFFLRMVFSSTYYDLRRSWKMSAAKRMDPTKMGK